MSGNPFADINNLCFFDTETRALPGASVNDGNVKTAGPYRYAKNAFVVMLTYAVAEEPVRLVELRDFDGALEWKHMPDDLKRHYDRAVDGKGWFAAWNAAFDRLAWNEMTYDFPKLDVDMTIDIMVQGLSSNLPGTLEGASKAVGRGGKQDDGKQLIALFSAANGPTPQQKPEEWARFCSYGVRDTDELREVYKRTRPLPPEEWEDYWISEDINERGVAIDLHFVERARLFADAEVLRLNKELARWTDGHITAVTQVQRITQYVWDHIDHSAARELMVTEWKEDAVVDDETDDVKRTKMSLAKDRIEALLAFYDHKARNGGLTANDQLVVNVLTARQFGGSTSPAKFHKMWEQHDGGRLRGQYAFNGAPQTGRYSSRGVQVHNLLRASLKRHEAEVIEFISSVRL